MEKYEEITTGKELIVRKKIATFIENFFKYLKCDFRHDTFKKIVYSETMYVTKNEEKMKNLFDAYVYLLNNYQNPFSENILKRFFYLIYEKEMDKDLLIRLTNLFFECEGMPPFEKAVHFNLEAYKNMVEIEENDRLVISLMFYNLALVKGQIPTVVFYDKKIHEYVKLRDSGTEEEMMKFLLEHLLSSKFQDKTFYENLELRSFSEVFNTIKKDQKILEKQGIKHLYIFGSYAKNSERVDSDIDLLVSMNDDLSYDQKREILNSLQDLYFKKLRHFVDFVEIGNYLSNQTIKDLAKINKVF